jgi:tRNA dimethylallyltransferase
VSDKDIVNKLLVVICGPTGVGKTATAIQLALHYQTGIVNADSRQVYKELNIGVGKPSQKQLSLVPHYLFGHKSIFDPYSVGHYTKDALEILTQQFNHHEIVFLSGGTGLYVKSIIEGMDDMPDVPDDVTDHWTNIWKKEGINALINALETYDPEYLTIVDKSNHIRMIRALALSSYTSKPYSSFLKKAPVTRPFNILPIVLELPRKELYAAIDKRVLNMLESGWLEEAKTLYPHKNLKALQTVGYKELFEVVSGNNTLENAIPLIQQSTRRYAKRQLTWWRNQGEWFRFNPENYKEIIQFIEKHRK